MIQYPNPAGDIRPDQLDNEFTRAIYSVRAVRIPTLQQPLLQRVQAANRFHRFPCPDQFQEAVFLHCLSLFPRHYLRVNSLRFDDGEGKGVLCFNCR